MVGDAPTRHHIFLWKLNLHPKQVSFAWDCHYFNTARTTGVLKVVNRELKK